MKKDLTTNYDDRQYMLARDFELYYYCDTQKGARTLMHTHPYYEFYFFLEGHAEAVIRQNHYILSYGDILVVPPRVSHGIMVRDFDIPYRRFDFWISTAFFNELAGRSADYAYVVEQAIRYERNIIHTDRITFNSILSKLFSIIEEEKGERFGRDMQLYLGVSDLLLAINRISNEQQEERPVSRSALYQNICSYIEQHIDEDLSLDSIAGHFYLSKFYIAHVFKDNIGISIHQYIQKQRLKLCHEAILGNRPIVEVYQDFGFEDYSSFYRAFKKEYGISPKELHKQAIQPTRPN